MKRSLPFCHSSGRPRTASRVWRLDYSWNDAQWMRGRRERMALDARQTGRTAVAELYEGRAVEYRGYASTLREAAVTALRSGRAPLGQDIRLKRLQ